MRFAISGSANCGVDRRKAFATGDVAVPCVQTRPKWAEISDASLGRRVVFRSFSGDYALVGATARGLARFWPWWHMLESVFVLEEKICD